MKSHLFGLSILVSFLSIQVFVSPGSADPTYVQNYNKQNNGNRNNNQSRINNNRTGSVGSIKPGSQYKRDQTEFLSNQLSAIPYIPGIPNYTGRGIQFGWGEEFPNARGGKVFAFTFYTTDPQYMVLRWYEQYLTNNGWSLDANGLEKESTSGSISANKGREVCRISTQPDDDNKVAVRIHYHGVSL